MNHPFINDRKEHFVPTMEINRKIENRKNIVLLMTGIFLAAELAVIAFVFIFLYQYRVAHEYIRELHLFDWSAPRLGQYMIFFAVSALGYFFLVYRNHIYQFRSSTGFADEAYKVIKSFSYAILLTIGFSFMFKYADYSRLVIVSYWAAGMMGAICVRWLRRRIYIRLAEKEYVSKNVVIVGAGRIGQSLMDDLNANKWLGYKVVGFVDDIENEDYGDNRFLGTTTKLKRIVQENVIDDLIITIPSERELVNQIITDLRKINIKIKIVPDMFNLVMSTVQIGNINALPVVTLVKTPMRGFGLLTKRLFDAVGSLVLLILLSPVFIITAISIKLNSRGPVFYKAIRIGQNGKSFPMYKFRSMHVHAEKMLDELMEDNEADGVVFKMKNDPRVTRVGRFIRKYSIDELPQLFNVVIGNMSLVGPRPPLPHEVQRYGDWEWRRLEVLPGITGLWQVSGRSNLSFQQWMTLDIYYIENWSLSLDLKILLKTIPAALKGEGAY